MMSADNMTEKRRPEPPLYEIQIEGCLDAGWSEWFDGLTITVEGAEDGSHLTFLTGVVVDQPALRGLLCKIWDMNLSVVSVSRLPSESKEPA